MKLYGRADSRDREKASVFLAEKNVACERLVGGAMSPLPALCAENAFPERVYETALVDGDRVVLGSMAICAYLEERFPEPAMFPRESIALAKVRYVEESFYASLNDVASRIARHLGCEPGSKPELGNTLVSNRLRPIMAYFDAMLSANRYLTGDQVTIADLSVGVAFRPLGRFGWIPLRSMLDDKSVFGQHASMFPRLAAYCEDLWGRPSFKQLDRVGWKHSAA